MKTKKAEIIFSLFLLLMFLTSVIIAISYDRQTRMFPLIIGVPGLILCVILFSSYYIPAVSKRLTTIKQKEFFKANDKEEQEDDEKKKKEFKKVSLKELNITIWIIGLLIIIYILGFMITIPLFIFLFLKFREKENLIISILFSVSSWVVIYIMFILILKAQLYGGIFF